jgi:hypothetical protein
VGVAPLAADNGRQSGGLVLRARDKDGAADAEAAETAAGTAAASASSRNAA